MWAFGVYDLGLTEATFWHLTPRQFHELSQRHLAAGRALDHRAGVLAALLAQGFTAGARGSKTYAPSDFFASLAPPDKRGGKPPPPRERARAIRSELSKIANTLPGTWTTHSLEGLEVAERWE